MKKGRKSNKKPPAEAKPNAVLDAMHEATAEAQAGGQPVYRVIRPFKYGGVYMAMNKPWVPLGNPGDEKIITCGRYVMLIDERLPEFKRPRTATMRVSGA